MIKIQSFQALCQCTHTKAVPLDTAACVGAVEGLPPTPANAPSGSGSGLSHVMCFKLILTIQHSLDTFTRTP